ncbi:hypothetical protein AB4277_20090 [Vibrio splendidus]
MNRFIAILLVLILVGCASNEATDINYTIDLEQAKIIGSNSSGSEVSAGSGSTAAGAGAAAAATGTETTVAATGVVAIAAPLAIAAPPTLLVSIPVSMMILSSSNFDKKDDVNVYYSYVLAGKTLKGSSARIKYDALIDEIRSRYPDLSSNSTYPVPKTNSFNLYLIPETKLGETDYDLSRHLVNLLASMQPKKFSKSGPYVVTTSQPLHNLNEHEPVDMYFFDLTGLELETIPEFVKDYREVNFGEVMGEFKEHKTFKLTMHSIVFKIDRFLRAGQKEYNDFTETLPSGVASVR